MEQPTGTIKVFSVGKLPREKYSDVNELAKDIAQALVINESQLVVNLIALQDLKGEPGIRGKRGPVGKPGGKGDIGPPGLTGPGLRWRDVWTITSDYDINDVVVVSNVIYISNTVHLSTAATEPGVGANWADVWDVMITLPASYTTLTTTQPVSGSPVPFKIGSYTAGAPTPAGWIAVQINGVNYKLSAEPI